MSHFLDRLNFFAQPKEAFADGHGQTTGEDRSWEDAYRNRWAHDKVVRSTFPSGGQVSAVRRPDEAQIELSAKLGAPFVELHTGAYANAYYTPKREKEFQRLRLGCARAHDVELTVNAGHGTLGWTHGAGSGRALAALMDGKRPGLAFGFLGEAQGSRSGCVVAA